MTFRTCYRSWLSLHSAGTWSSDSLPSEVSVSVLARLSRDAGTSDQMAKVPATCNRCGWYLVNGMRQAECLCRNGEDQVSPSTTILEKRN